MSFKITLDSWQDRGLFLSPIIQKYLQMWKMKMIHQDHYGIITLLRGISCLAMKNVVMIDTGYDTVDPRIPLIYFSDSGSGKGAGNSIYTDIFSQVGVNIFTVGKPTPEKLVGSTDTSVAQRNILKGYTEDDEKYRDPHIRGFFEDYDDLIFEEAGKWFSTQEGEEMLRLIRMAQDKYGSPTNEMKSETLKNTNSFKYPCKCNVALLTHFGTTQDISEQIIHNGIFQRNLALFYHLSKDMIEDIIMRKKAVSASLEDFEAKKQEVIRDLKQISTFIASQMSKQKVVAGREVEEHINLWLTDRLNYYFEKDSEAGKMVQSFFPRLKDSIYKVACAFALLKKERKITMIEADEALEIIALSFDSLVLELIEHGVLAKQQQKFYVDLKRALGGRIYTKNEVAIIMGQWWGMSPPTTRKRLKKLNALFKTVTKEEKKGRGNTQFVKLM